MATRLKIIWDGDVEGLSEHRISVAKFGPSIINLLKLLRRIASDIVTKAIPNTERTLKGRYAKAAENIDIEIARIEQNSSGLSLAISFTPPPHYQDSLLGDLEARAAIEFCDSIESESNGVLKNSNVRDWLDALPSGLQQQKYYVENEAGVELRRPVILTDVQLAERPQEMPYLAKQTGNVIALGFEPGKTEIRLKRDDGGTLIFSATQEQVLTAWRLRDVRVRVLFVKAKDRRLLNIQSVEENEFEVTDRHVNEHIFQRWPELLRRLAQ